MSTGTPMAGNASATDPETAPGSFRPAWWLRSPHLQTVWPVAFRRRPRLSLAHERLELPDGDFLDLAWLDPGEGPLVVLLHGLEGGIRSAYAAGMMRALAGAGCGAVLMHFRGCGGAPNRLPRSYHSGETGDLDFVLRALGRRAPGRPLAALGYSLGGNVLLKWLGERGRDAPLAAAAAVSVPFDLHDAAARLERGASRLYQWWLLRRLRAKTRDKAARGILPARYGRVGHLESFRAFDEHVTAPLHGFAGADDYYTRSSSRRYLAGIRVPTLVVHAEDDPFMTPRAVPGADELPPAVRLELSAHGGHVGFVAGALPLRPRYWLEARIPPFLAARAGAA